MNLANDIRKNFSDEFLRIFSAAGKEAARHKSSAALVGGVVRDVILKKPVKEADIMFDPPAGPIVEALAKAFKAETVSHPIFLTFTLKFPSGTKVDLVRAREEKYPKPAALPLVRPSRLSEDLRRRDFTVNAMACLLDAEKFGEVLDPFNGRADLKAKKIRILHSKSFEDDPTRVFRAARFAGRLDYQLESETAATLRRTIAGGFLEYLSPVRRRHEFEAILKEADPVPALRLLESWGALAAIHRVWKKMAEGFTEALKSEEGESDNRWIDRLALWLKPLGAEKARAVLNDLAFERNVKRLVLSKI